MSGARDFDTELLAFLGKLRGPISEFEKAGLRGELKALKPPTQMTKEDFRRYFTMIYDTFHTDMDLYPALAAKLARKEIVKEFYSGLGVKLLSGKSQEYVKIVHDIYNEKQVERALKKAQREAEFEERAIQELLTNAFVNSVLKGGARKQLRGKTRRGKRSTKRVKKH